MIKISLPALLKILVENNQQFGIRKSKEYSEEEPIIIFYGEFKDGGYVYYKDYYDRRNPQDLIRGMANLLHYNLHTQYIVAICTNWLEIINTIKSNAKEISPLSQPK